MHGDLLPLLVITVLAALVPVVANRLGRLALPLVVVEIIAGMAIGKSGLDMVRSTPYLDFLAEFGFIYLMFLSGLEMNFAALLAPAPGGRRENWWRRPAVLACAVFALTLSLAAGAGWGLASLGWAKSALLMGLILSTTSLGIVVPVLKERRLISGAYGQCLLVNALIGDFATLLMLGLAIALVSQGPGVHLLFFLLMLACFAAMVRLGQRARRTPFWAKLLEELSHATAQIRVRGAFALMVGWVFLAQALGVEVILGAFLAGAFISIISGEAEEVHREKLEAVGYGFFIPVFFINVGVEFDLGALTDFQLDVYDVVSSVRYGRITHYGAIAEQLGLGSAGARAVGQAVGANPVAIVIPCHRVVGSDGTLHGYSGGLSRKTALLRLEGIVVDGVEPTSRAHPEELRLPL